MNDTTRPITADSEIPFPCWLRQNFAWKYHRIALGVRTGEYIYFGFTHYDTSPADKKPEWPVIGSASFAETIAKAQGHQGPPEKPILFAAIDGAINTTPTPQPPAPVHTPSTITFVGAARRTTAPQTHSPMRPERNSPYDLALFYYEIARRDCIAASKDKSPYNRTTREIQAGAALDAKQDLDLERRKLWKTN